MTFGIGKQKNASKFGKRGRAKTKSVFLEYWKDPNWRRKKTAEGKSYNAV